MADQIPDLDGTAAADGTGADWQLDAPLPFAWIDDGQLYTAPRCWVVALPKSGTHAGVPLVASMAQQLGEKPWLGNMAGHAFLRGTREVEEVLDNINNMPPASWLKGHLAPDPEGRIPQAMYRQGISVLHVYRDLRDVAVSQSFHSLTAGIQDPQLKHPAVDIFRALDTFEDVMVAVIEGIYDERLKSHPHAIDGPYWPSLIRRWEDYARWLDYDWVFQCPYNHLVDRFDDVAETWIRYVIARTLETVDPNGFRHKYKVSISRGSIDMLLQGMRLHFYSKQLSPTFRKGKASGGWKEHWTPRICRAFVEQGGHTWLIRLGFEPDDSWIDEWL